MQLPIAFAERMQRLLGEEYSAFCAALEQPKAVALRCNPTYLSPEALATALGVELTAVGYEPYGYFANLAPSGKHPLHHAGAFYMQDPSAMLTVASVEVPQGGMVLDLCAAPGGKTTQLAAHMQGKGVLVANEIDLGRAKILLGNVERMGIANALVTSLAPSAVADTFGAAFDLVVVDAPCSGEGMFRKNPQAVALWNPGNVALCQSRGRQILDCAMRCVRQGGKLVYSTCTFAPEENEQAVQYMLDSGDFCQIRTKEGVQKATAEGIGQPLSRRFYPHLGAGEGHFVAVLERVTPTPAPPKPKLPSPLTSAERKLVQSFAKENLTHLDLDSVWRIGENLFYLPNPCAVPQFALLTYGVKLGSVQKGRFVPHHMFFKCLADRFLHHTHLSLEDARTAAYLHGDTIEVSHPSGYGVVEVMGCPLGGVKATDYQGKNHYPKGLRND